MEYKEYQRQMKSPMLHPVAVEPRDGYSIWIRFVDGAEGVADVSFLKDHGAFQSLKDRNVFEKVHIDECGDVSWGCYDGIELDICTEDYYFEFLGLNPYTE